MRAVHWAIVVASARLGTCPGRGAAFFMPLRRAGTLPDTGVRYGPGSAAHRYARATRCAASGAQVRLCKSHPVAMESVRHPAAELDEGCRTGLDVGGVEHREVAAVFPCPP